MIPQKFREIVFQLLFSIDMGGPEGDLTSFLMRELSVSRKSVHEAYEKARAIWSEKDRLDAMIKGRSLEYAIDRIQKVERNLLRLALYELNDENKKIVISEAIRLCRKFSTPEATKFVNAILDDESTLSPQEEQAAL